MKSKLVACGLGLLSIAVVASLQASALKRFVGLTVTGQTTSYAVGDDGDYEMGWTVPIGTRFVDNADGTVTDNLTGLIWLKNANCFGERNWTAALSDANTLSDGACDLTDGSVAGDWRLPNLKELQSLVDYSNVSPALPTGHPFSGVVSGIYWSSTSTGADPPFDAAWCVYLVYAKPVTIGTRYSFYLWPVRGGQ